MPYIIDGHNLIPKIPGLHLDDPDDEQQLIGLLQEFCRLSRKQVDVYFDNAAAGQAGRRALGTVAVHFVRHGQTADTAIRSRLLKMGRSAKNWTVVSSDQSIQITVRQVGAKPMPSEEFAALLRATLSSPHPKEGRDITLSAEEVDEWERLFRKRGSE